jgi:hypothetical protein
VPIGGLLNEDMARLQCPLCRGEFGDGDIITPNHCTFSFLKKQSRAALASAYMTMCDMCIDKLFGTRLPSKALLSKLKR